MRTSCLSICAALWLLPAAAAARYARVDIENVPMERLAKNLGAAVQKDPGNVTLLSALGRLHAMAYALRTEEMPAAHDQPWYGYESRWLSRVPRARPAPRTPAARAHLTEALSWFRKAVAAQPGDLTARLGLGWCLDQSGQKAAAIAAYRQVLRDAWQREKDQTGRHGESLVQETAEYLLTLLDQPKDGPERKQILDKIQHIQKQPRAVTPILVPLAERTALADLIDPGAAVPFDLDGSGALRRWGWITPAAGWLVYDPLARGRITSGLQLLGAVSFWIFWQHGYQALCALDDDGDGELRGAELAGLALWADGNRDGVSQPGEVTPLSSLHVAALSCAHAPHPSGIRYSPAGIRYQDGRVAPTYDWVPTSAR